MSPRVRRTRRQPLTEDDLGRIRAVAVTFVQRNGPSHRADVQAFVNHRLGYYLTKSEFMLVMRGYLVARPHMERGRHVGLELTTPLRAEFEEATRA